MLAADKLHGRSPASLIRWSIAVAALSAAAWGLAVTADWDVAGDSVAALAARPELVLLAAGGFTAAFVLRTFAWRALLHDPADLRMLFRALQASLFFNHLLPFKAGEVVRVGVAARHAIPAGEALASTVVARMLDVAALLALSVALLGALGNGGAQALPLGLSALALLAAAVALLIVRERPHWLPLPARLRGLLETVREPLRGLGARRLALAVLWIVPSWLLEACVLIAVAEASGAELSLVAAAAVTAFTILFQIVHITPGGIGIYEASMAGALHSQGIPVETAVAVATVTHGVKFAYAFSVGLACTLWEWRAPRRELRRATHEVAA